MTKKKGLEKRQPIYKIGCIVELTEKGIDYEWFYPKPEEPIVGVVIEHGGNGYWRSKKYWVKIKMLNGEYAGRERWFAKSRHIRLVSKNTAIMESL